MKLRMAENSLFAILLRQPWWVSLLIAGLMALAAAALLPPAYRVVGMLSGFPLVVISGMAAWRQSRQPDPARVQALQQTLAAMSWPAFSAQLEQAFARAGYAVNHAGGDKGFDFRLERAGDTTLVCARRWKSARTGHESLRKLQQARAAAGVDPLPKGLYIGLGELTPGASDYASQQHLSIWQGAELAQLLAGREAPKLK